MLFEQIKGFYHGIAKMFLLVGRYTMLSWQLNKEVLIAVYQHLNIKARFNLFGLMLRDSPIHGTSQLSHIYLYITLVLGFVSYSCNNYDIILVLWYNCNSIW